ncbi:hypothetical protein KBD11_02665 [Candidatus Saccharibacteria bacterium]|nr:hypothetical protein [Candidatus Saccharibacteria bacterium]
MTLIDKATKLRLRRNIRLRQRQVERVTQSAEFEFEKKVIGKLEKLRHVKRFVASWVILMLLLVSVVAAQTVGLSQYYLKSGPVPGGVYNEGMLGTFSNANPMYAVGAVDTSVSRLLFSGLFRYDESNTIVGDLAEGYSVDDSGRQYTVDIKRGLRWHDGKPLTSKDVAFTFNAIKNPDARSPLFASWQGINIVTPSANTVIFQLPNALTAFPYSLTTGILPAHILGSVPTASLRSHTFNTTAPVGAGPFMWSALQLGGNSTPNEASSIISLKAFPDYNSGRPKLDGFTLHTYDTADKLVSAYKKKIVEAAAGLQSVPTDISDNPDSYIYQFRTTAAVMVFFKTSEGLLADRMVRKALVLGSDRERVLSGLGYSAKPVRGPLLDGQLGYDLRYNQPSFNREEAAKVLQEAGWVLNTKTGMREKNGQSLQFQLLAEDTRDNRRILTELQSQWKNIGVMMQPSWQQNQADMQGAIETHGYTALLYGIGIGVDPDVYVYWDSTQADPRSASRLNFSEYKSTAADTALESGRTRSDSAIRVLRYQAFQKVWQEDFPALALYQPNVFYVTRGGDVSGLTEHNVNTDADRYYSVTDWAVKTGHVPR